jgi:transcriptional regulator with GAF, ATPase, and Fis domain
MARSTKTVDTILAGQVWRGETVNRRKDGSLYTEEQTIAPVRNAQGEITHFISIKQDITRRKAAEDALQRHAGQIETLNRVMQSLSATLDLHRVMRVILRELQQFVPYDIASVMLLEGGEMEVIAVHGVDDPQVLGLRFDIQAADNPNAEVVRTQAPLRIADVWSSYESFAARYLRKTQSAAGWACR